MAGVKPSVRNRVSSSSYWKDALLNRTVSIREENSNRISSSSTNILAWEKEIRALSSLLVAAKEQRNSCSITCVIPVEVLSRIFEALQAAYPLSFSFAEGRVTSWGWLSATQVCQHWRAVAKAQASLWTDITIMSMPLWNLFIENSGNLPIAVSGCLHEVKGPITNYKKLIKGALLRIKELKIHIHCNQEPNCLGCRRGKSLMTILNSSSRRLPHLKLLQLASETYKSAGLTARFFDSRATELRDVTLQNNSYPLGAIAPNLRRLTLIEANCFNLRLFLDTLRQLPCLEDLSLIDMLDVPLLTSTVSPIELPRVRNLHLRNNIQQCISLWSSLQTHFLAHVEVDTSPSSSCSDLDLHALARAVTSHLNYPGRPTFTQLDLSTCDERPLCDFMMSSPAGSTSSHGSSTPTTVSPHPNPSLRVVAPIVSEFPCHQVANVYRVLFSGRFKKEWTALGLTGHMHWDKQLLTSVFLDAHLVDCLSVMLLPLDSVHAICSGLAAFSPHNTPQLFPLLSTLRFDDVNFGCPSDTCDGDSSAVPHLTNALMLRAGNVPAGKHWHAVSHLHIEDCSVAERHINGWREYVPDSVFWDGETGRAHAPPKDTEDEDMGKDEEAFAGDDDVDMEE
ncbi:hypothetical protein PENSPDRAFT_681671 [Peniophora sp. CONT]|nr:hypothetical protein PENSPDRAFT_681671 [Peniophora sp. CONT]